MTLDLSLLWDFSRPEVSEQRLRAVLDPAYAQRICPGGNGIFSSG